MTTRTKPEIDWSTFPESDGEPMAENVENVLQMTDLIFALQRLFRTQGRSRAVAGGNQFLYYNRHNGRDHVSPDVYAAFDVTPPAPPKWQTWVQGKSPDIVWESTSESTWQEDLGTKRDLYTRLGVQEYYVFDPQGGLQPPFRGFSLRGGQLEPLPMLPSGGIMSALLRAELRPVAMEQTKERLAATYLRIVDPLTGDPVIVPEELSQKFDAAEARLMAEERARYAAEQARRAAEQRVMAEEQARLTAEQRAAQAEEALRAALAQLEQHRDQDPAEGGE